MVHSESIGIDLHEKFVVERLQPKSKTSIFAPLKKANVKTCKSANRTKKNSINDKVVELKNNCNLFARCAVLTGKRDIDMRIVVGDYELMTVPRSLMTGDGKLIPGHPGKSELLHELMRECEVLPTEAVRIEPQTQVVIDAMYAVNTIMLKPSWIVTGDDLASEFLKRIDAISQNSEAVAIAFDTYRDVSLIYTTRNDRKEKGK